MIKNRITDSMKESKIKKISIICSILGFILSLFSLIIGLQSIGTNSWERLGIIFIMPSIIALIIIILDFLIAVDKIKKGLIYSCIISVIKIGIIIYIIPITIYDLKDQVQYTISNLELDLILITFFIIFSIPSILNIIKIISFRKNNK